MPFEHRQHDDAVVDDPIDDSVGTQEGLAYVVASNLWNDATGPRRRRYRDLLLTEALDPSTSRRGLVERDATRSATARSVQSIMSLGICRSPEACIEPSP